MKEQVDKRVDAQIAALTLLIFPHSCSASLNRYFKMKQAFFFFLGRLIAKCTATHTTVHCQKHILVVCCNYMINDLYILLNSKCCRSFLDKKLKTSYTLSFLS